jgi:hypothetical protein
MNISSGQIEPGVLYQVFGSGDVTYNGFTRAPGLVNNTFRGVFGVTVFTTTGAVTIAEVTEFKGASIAYVEDYIDRPIFADGSTIMKGCGIEYILTEQEKTVAELTVLKGFAIELTDYPFYCFAITETRL